jgi:outer membrane protein assembly factor BamB
LVAGSVKDGEQIWQQRLSGLGGTWATPVASGGRIFIFDQAGIGLVVEDQGDSAETIMEVDLEEPVLASPAIANGKLIVRTNQSLFCFE